MMQRMDFLQFHKSRNSLPGTPVLVVDTDETLNVVCLVDGEWVWTPEDKYYEDRHQDAMMQMAIDDVMRQGDDDDEGYE
jgi:hypothetical protein